MSSTRPVVELRHVSVRRCGRGLVRRVSLCANRGEFLALFGSGASTMQCVIAGVLEPDTGRVWVDPAVRVVAHGPSAARRVLADPGRGQLLVLVGATAGLSDVEAGEMLAQCRQRAAEGLTVIANVEDAQLALRHAHTSALLVAGHLVAWGEPAVVEAIAGDVRSSSQHSTHRAELERRLAPAPS